MSTHDLFMTHGDLLAMYHNITNIIIEELYNYTKYNEMYNCVNIAQSLLLYIINHVNA